MTILASEMKVFRARTSSTDPAANGGRMSDVEVTSARGKLFGDITSAQLTSGLTTWEKFFVRCRSASESSGTGNINFLDFPTPYGDYSFFVAASQDGVQADLTGSERKYAAALVAQDITGSPSQIVITLDDAALSGMVANGNKAILTDYSPSFLLQTTGKHEIVTVSGTPTLAGLQLTVPLAAPVGGGDYTTANKSRLCMLYEHPGSLFPQVQNVMQGSGSVYDFTGHPLVLSHKGAERMKLSWNYISGSQVNLSCDDPEFNAALGTFLIANDIAPVNPRGYAGGAPLFIWRAAGHGSPAVGASGSLDIIPSSIPFWACRVVPPNTAAILPTQYPIRGMVESV